MGTVGRMWVNCSAQCLKSLLGLGDSSYFAVLFLAAGGKGESLQEGEAEREEKEGRGRFDI